MSINSPCVRRGRLSECTIRLGYAPFWGVDGGGDCWQIGGLATFINSPCVRCGRLGECTIRRWYAPFLTTTPFRRVGST